MYVSKLVSSLVLLMVITLASGCTRPTPAQPDAPVTQPAREDAPPTQPAQDAPAPAAEQPAQDNPPADTDNEPPADDTNE